MKCWTFRVNTYLSLLPERHRTIKVKRTKMWEGWPPTYWMCPYSIKSLTSGEPLQKIFRGDAILSHQLLSAKCFLSSYMIWEWGEKKKKIPFFSWSFKEGNVWKYFVLERLLTTATSTLSNLVLMFSWIIQFCAVEELSSENLLMAIQLNEVEWK